MAARRVLLSGLALLGLTVGGAALAWACSPQADLKLTGPGGSGLAYPGSTVTLEAGAPRGWEPGTVVTVTASWNGGQTVATGTGPEFTATVPVPNVPDGVYNFAARGVEQSTGNARVGYASLRVAEPGAAPTAGSGASPGSDSTAAAGRPTRAPAPGSTSGSTSGTENVVSGRDTRSASGAVRGEGRVRARGGAPAGAAPAAPKADVGVKTLASGQAVFADSVGANTPKAAPAARRDGAGRSARSTASKGSASGDLWSGFASDKAPAASLGGSVGPESGPGSGLTLGLALSAFGLVALLGGAGVAEARRRRRARSGGA